jgi:hypothetical protein
MAYTFQEIRSYAELYQIAQSFAAGKLGFVIVVSPPGTGKTDTFREVILKECVFYEGGLSPYKFFCNHYDQRDEDVVFDDVDEIFKTASGINLFKSLCNTHKPKWLMYEKATKQLDDLGIPHRYKTTSNVMMFCNTVGTVAENLGAVLDRAHRYRFNPTPREIHDEVGKWFKDTEIYDWVGERLHLITQAPSMRAYVLAREKKDAGLDWRAFLMNEWSQDPKLAAVLTIMRDSLLDTKEKRAAKFAEWGHGEVATYMRYQRKAIEMGLAAKPTRALPKPSQPKTDRQKRRDRSRRRESRSRHEHSRRRER